MENNKYPCPCCGYKTLDEKPPGTYDICPICFWEDDAVQYRDPDYEGGANSTSLRIAQQNFKGFGASEKRRLKYVRSPNENDIFVGEVDISNIRRMPIVELIKIFIALDLPIEKILDLYNGTIEVENSNFIFNREELEQYYTLEESHDYFLLSRKYDSKDRYFSQNEKEDLFPNLGDKEEIEKMNLLKQKFIDAISKDG